MPPTTSTEFDRAYRSPVTLWGDIRIPAELKALAQKESPRRSLELGCGIGRFSRYLAQQGLCARLPACERAGQPAPPRPFALVLVGIPMTSVGACRADYRDLRIPALRHWRLQRLL